MCVATAQNPLFDFEATIAYELQKFTLNLIRWCKIPIELLKIEGFYLILSEF